MLKLNLLPPNIHEPRKKRAWFALFLVVWIALAGGLIAWQLSLVNLKSQKTEELQQQEAIVQQVQQTEQEAQRTRAMVAPLLARAQLADEIFRYNRQYPKLYREVRRWTIDTVRYGSLGVAQGMTLQAQAVTRDLDEMARYLQIMLQCPLFTGVSVSWTGSGGSTAPTAPTGFAAGGAPFGAPGAPPFGGAPYGVGAPYGAPTSIPGAPGIPTAAPGMRGTTTAGQTTQQGVVFSVVATLREPIMSQVQQLVQQLTSSLGGGAMPGMGMPGMGAGMGMPGAPMMGPGMPGAPPMMGPGMPGAPPMGGPPRGAAPGLGGRGLSAVE